MFSWVDLLFGMTKPVHVLIYLFNVICSPVLWASFVVFLLINVYGTFSDPNYALSKSIFPNVIQAWFINILSSLQDGRHCFGHP